MTAAHSIYVASSWRNTIQPALVKTLRTVGHRVYDFKQPNGAPERGFHWTDANLAHSNPVDRDPLAIDLADVAQYLASLDHPAAVEGFQRDFDAMLDADAVVLVLPCGRSAHLELGWAVGAGKRTAILLDDGPCTPELMYRMVDKLATSLHELIRWLAEPELDRAIPPGYPPEHILTQLRQSPNPFRNGDRR